MGFCYAVMRIIKSSSQGRLAAHKAVILNAHRNGLPSQLIANLIGLSEAEVIQLLQGSDVLLDHPSSQPASTDLPANRPITTPHRLYK